jgi:seryl-tRNA synthetase
MLDIHRVLAETDALAKRLDDRAPGVGDAVRKIAERYNELKKLKTKSESLQAEKNAISKLIGELAKSKPANFAALSAPQQEQVTKILGDSAKTGFSFEALKNRPKEISPQIDELNKQIAAIETDVNAMLLTVPNVPLPSVPAGKSEADNKVVRAWGEPRKFDFKALDHADLGEKLDILDFTRGVKIAQARFTLLKGMAARMQMALINFMLDHHQARGYTHVWPPFLVNAKSMTGTGQLPKFEADLFKTTNEPPLYLIPTAEVPVTNIYADEILAPGSLPIRYVAYTPCFRSEAGSYGKDTRGLIRQHQFEKVELVKFVLPEDSEKEHEALVADAESVLQALKLPYRTVLLCTADQGFGAAKCYDLEVWLPGQNAYREISSCSNFTDFQARRAGIRFRRDAKAKPEFLHTLNGSGLAVGRTLVAILENYQRADGSIEIPEPLRKYLGGAAEIRAQVL